MAIQNLPVLALSFGLYCRPLTGRAVKVRGQGKTSATFHVRGSTTAGRFDQTQVDGPGDGNEPMPGTFPRAGRSAASGRQAGLQSCSGPSWSW